jgi:RNA polymerase subunit RPABC4/transcription elongation factor Spt4
MKSSSAQVLGVVLVVLLILLAVGALRFLVLIPLGIVDGVDHGLRLGNGDRWGTWFRPWAGFAGLFGLIALFIWVAVVVWVYRDAKERGMEGALWALLVFFTHLLGFIIYLLVRSGHPVLARKEPGPPSAAPGPTGPACRSCGKPTEKDHLYCHACGDRLKNVCPKCGKDTRSDWQICPYCGDKL